MVRRRGPTIAAGSDRPRRRPLAEGISNCRELCPARPKRARQTICRPFIVNRLGAKKRAAHKAPTRSAPDGGRPSSSAVGFRQGTSSRVKCRQVLSSLVKPLLDGAPCNFNDLPRTFLDNRAAAGTWAADAASTRHGDETRITRLSAPAKKLSASRDDAALLQRRRSLAGSAVDLMEASFFQVRTLSMVFDRRRRRAHRGCARH